jgi:hypothetical protein
MIEDNASLQPAAQLQSVYTADVLSNRLNLEHRWGKPCLSYFACMRPGMAAAKGLAGVQDAIGDQPALLRVPPAALHTSLVWLLPVHEEFTVPKDDLWAEQEPRWLAIFRQVLASLPRFRLSFTQVVATDTAVIAVASAPNQAGELRRRLTRCLDLPWLSSSGSLVHTTLFRYRGALGDPASFLRHVRALEVTVHMAVREVLILREMVFPSLQYEIVHRFPLPTRGKLLSMDNPAPRTQATA